MHARRIAGIVSRLNARHAPSAHLNVLALLAEDKANTFLFLGEFFSLRYRTYPDSRLKLLYDVLLKHVSCILSSPPMFDVRQHFPLLHDIFLAGSSQ